MLHLTQVRFLKKIHETLANVGHDTQLCKASNETYNNLHPCCQYVRKDSL